MYVPKLTGARVQPSRHVFEPAIACVLSLLTDVSVTLSRIGIDIAGVGQAVALIGPEVAGVGQAVAFIGPEVAGVGQVVAGVGPEVAGVG